MQQMRETIRLFAGQLSERSTPPLRFAQCQGKLATIAK